MNKLLPIAMLLANASAEKAVHTQKMVEIVEGVLKGALDAEGFDDISHCIQDVETVVTDAEAAVKDFKAGGVDNVIAGIKEVSEILKVVKTGMSDCSHIKADWKKLEAMSAIFMSPTSFAYHVGKDLLINRKDIYREIKTSITDYEAQNWESFGYNIGEAAAKVILGQEEMTAVAEPTEEQEATAKFIQGFYKGMDVGAFNLEALLICVYEEDQAALIVYEAVQMIEDVIATKDYEELIGVAIATVAAFQQFKQGLPACEAIDTSAANWTKYNQAASIIEHHDIKTIGKNIIMGGEDITQDMKSFITNYQAGQFEQMGESLAKAFTTATVPAEDNLFLF